MKADEFDDKFDRGDDISASSIWPRHGVPARNNDASTSTPRLDDRRTGQGSQTTRRHPRARLGRRAGWPASPPQRCGVPSSSA